MKALSFAALALLLAAPPALAQVGHDPQSSPYSDLEYKQEITPYGGYARARVDPAGILPQSAPIAGLRYEVYLAGPISFASDVSAMFADRTVIDPTKARAQRVIGTETASVYAADVGLTMALTGRKSWHNIVPNVRTGLGVVTGPAADDTTGYKFGTSFALTFGGGLKFVAGRVQLRADYGERLFKQKYPEAYFRPSSDGTAVLATSTKDSFWTHHSLFTVGVSLLFDR